MRQTAPHWTATKKLTRALLLIGALLPLAGVAGCPPTKESLNQENSGSDSDSSSDSSGGSY